MKTMLFLLVSASLTVAGCSPGPFSDARPVEALLPDAGGWRITFPSGDGGLDRATAPRGRASVIIDLPRGRWLPVLAEPAGWGRSAGAVVWQDTPGPASGPPYWRNPAPAGTRRTALTLSGEAAPLAEILLSVWTAGSAFREINLERIHAAMMDKSGGDTRRVDTARLRSDLLYHSLSSYSIRLLPEYSLDLFLPPALAPEESVLLECADPASSVSARFEPGGRLRLEAVHDGIHRFRSEGLELTLHCAGGRCVFKID